MTTRFVSVLSIAALATLAACGGQTGTFSISLVTAPGSNVLDNVTHARVTLSDPLTVVDADRTATGFDFDFDVVASGQNGTLLFEGFAADGTTIALGQTPDLPVSGVNATATIYVAAPQSLAAAPVALPAARSQMGIGSLGYGIMLVGGLDSTNAPTADVNVYSAYTHALQTGVDLPAPRSASTVIFGSYGYAYVFGGNDAAGAPQSDFWRFDTTVSPGGSFTALTSSTALSRANQLAVALGGDDFLLTGNPVVLLDGLSGTATPLTTPASLPPTAVSVEDDRTSAQDIYTCFVGQGAGTSGAVLFVNGAFADFTVTAGSTVANELQRIDHGMAATSIPSTVAGTADEPTITVIGGVTLTDTAPTTALRIHPVTQVIDIVSDALVTARSNAAVAATDRYLLVAGGTDVNGTVLTDAELLDPATLAHIATIPMVVPRTGATAEPLSNGQILIAGGTDANGAAIATFELFTPAAPAQ